MQQQIGTVVNAQLGKFGQRGGRDFGGCRHVAQMIPASHSAGRLNTCCKRFHNNLNMTHRVGQVESIETATAGSCDIAIFAATGSAVFENT